MLGRLGTSAFRGLGLRVQGLIEVEWIWLVLTPSSNKGLGFKVVDAEASRAPEERGLHSAHQYAVTGCTGLYLSYDMLYIVYRSILLQNIMDNSIQ